MLAARCGDYRGKKKKLIIILLLANLLLADLVIAIYFLEHVQSRCMEYVV